MVRASSGPAAEDGANRALTRAVATNTCDGRGKKMKLLIVAGLALTTSLLAIDKEPAKRLGEAASFVATRSVPASVVVSAGA